MKLTQAIKVLLASAMIPTAMGQHHGLRKNHGKDRKQHQNNIRNLDFDARRKMAASRYLAASSTVDKIPGEYTIQFVPGKEREGRSLVEGLIKTYPGSKLLGTYTKALVGVSLAGIPKNDMMDVLVNNLDIVSLVEEDIRVHATAFVSDELWGLDRIDDDEGLDNDYTVPGGLDGEGVDIYILDTGVNQKHQEFVGRIGDSHDTTGEGAGFDLQGHGTHVAGTAAGQNYGVAKGATIYDVKVLDGNGSGTDASVIAGIEWAINHNNGAGRRKVINMSLGGGASQSIDDAVQSAVDEGIVVVVAAGNENSDACGGSPARASAVITVGSTTLTDARSDFSNWGSCVDIFAPGSAILSAHIPDADSFATLGGTSMASPHVAGAAALYLQHNPDAVASTVQMALTDLAVNGKITDVQGSPNKLLNVACIDGSCGGEAPEQPPTDNPETPPPSDGTCQDVSGFEDSWGYTCEDYEFYYEQNDCWDADDFIGSEGSANDACCWCGGGSN